MFESLNHYIFKMTEERKEILAFFEDEYMEWQFENFTVVWLGDGIVGEAIWAFWVYDKSKMDKIIEIPSEEDELLFLDKIEHEIRKGVESNKSQLSLF